MADKIFHEIGKAGAIPVAQILRTRRDFPGRNLTYELQLSGADWRSIGALAAACDAAGLRLTTLRCIANGQAFCALGDDGSADLGTSQPDLLGRAPVAHFR
jgi:hypothetical protein